RAVAVVFDHFLQAADLPFDAAQPVAIGNLDFRIDAHRFAHAGIAGAGGVGSRSAFTCRWHSHSPDVSIYPLPLYSKHAHATAPKDSESTKSPSALFGPRFLRTLGEGAGGRTDGSLCYYAAHDTCGSNLRIAETAGGRRAARAGNVCQYLRLAALPDQRQETFVVRVRRLTPAGNASGACAAAPEYRGNEEGQLAARISRALNLRDYFRVADHSGPNVGMNTKR